MSVALKGGVPGGALIGSLRTQPHALSTRIRHVRACNARSSATVQVLTVSEFQQALEKFGFQLGPEVGARRWRSPLDGPVLRTRSARGVVEPGWCLERHAAS